MIKFKRIQSLKIRVSPRDESMKNWLNIAEVFVKIETINTSYSALVDAVTIKLLSRESILPELQKVKMKAS